MAEYIKVLDADGVERFVSAKELAGNLHVMRGLTQFLIGTTATDVTQTTPLPSHLREADGTDVAITAKLGSLIEIAPTTDTASSGLNGRLQRIAQRLTSTLARGGTTGSPVPTDAQYTGINVAGNLRGVTGLALGSHFAAGMVLLDGSGAQITSFGTPAAVSMHHRILTNSTNAVNIKASAAVLWGVAGFNGHDYAIQICFHNTAGTPTAGASIVRKYVAAAGQHFNFPIPGGGVAFATGLGMSVVYSTTGLLTDTVATPLDATDKACVEVAYV